MQMTIPGMCSKYEELCMWKVYYPTRDDTGATVIHTALFEDHKQAHDFAKLVGGRLNHYLWQVKVEE